MNQYQPKANAAVAWHNQVTISFLFASAWLVREKHFFREHWILAVYKTKQLYVHI